MVSVQKLILLSTFQCNTLADYNNLPSAFLVREALKKFQYNKSSKFKYKYGRKLMSLDILVTARNFFFVIKLDTQRETCVRITGSRVVRIVCQLNTDEYSVRARF